MVSYFWKKLIGNGIIICPSIQNNNSICSFDSNTNEIDFLYFNCQASSTSNAILNGIMIFNFTSGVCTTSPVSDGGVTINKIYVPGLYRLSPAGAKIYFDSSSTTGYATKVTGGSIINIPTPNNVSISISGINIKGVSNASTPIWDHTIYTPSNLTLSVATNKTINAGTIIVQNNLLKYTATVTINQPLIWTPPCSFPIQGKLSTTFSGSQTGSESLVFTNICGTAKLTQGSSSKNIKINDTY
jgi:hypothetical protein